MSERERHYTSTVMRMAGNIAAGYVSAEPHLFNADLIARRSVEIAEAIVREVLSRPTIQAVH